MEFSAMGARRVAEMVSIGDRVRIVGVMADDPCPMEVGSEGTVNWIGEGQIGVAWDSGRGLLLLPEDPFIVTSRAATPRGDGDG